MSDHQPECDIYWRTCMAASVSSQMLSKREAAAIPKYRLGHRKPLLRWPWPLLPNEVWLRCRNLRPRVVHIASHPYRARGVLNQRVTHYMSMHISSFRACWLSTRSEGSSQTINQFEGCSQTIPLPPCTGSLRNTVSSPNLNKVGRLRNQPTLQRERG